MPAEKLSTTHPTETATTRITPEDATDPLLQELLNSSHNWERLAARPHTLAHREFEDEIGQSVAPGFGEMPPALKEAVAVSAELGDLALPSPPGRLSRLRQFFRFGRKPPVVASPVEATSPYPYTHAETTPISPLQKSSETAQAQDTEHLREPQTLTEHAARLEELIAKAAAVPIETSHNTDAMQAFNNTRYETLWRPGDDLKQMLRGGNYSSRELSAFLGAARHASDFAPNGYRTKFPREERSSYSSVVRLLDDVPPETLRSAYFSQADSERGNLRYMLRADAANRNVTVAYAAAEKLARIYDCPVGDLFKPGVAESDPIVQSIVQRKDFYRVTLEAIPRSPKHGETNADFSAIVRHAEAEFLRGIGLPEDLVNHVRQAIDSRTMARDMSGNVLTGEDRSVDVVSLKKTLARFGEAVQAIGLEKALQLPETCGIVDLSCYAPEQLERMLKFAQGDAELIADLQAGDVTVAFIDRQGDHNGAGVSFAKDIEKPSGRTLFFEIHKPEDLQKYSELLLRSRVKPSTVIAGAHGSPGAMFIGDIYNGGFIVTNADPARMREAEVEDGVRRVALQAKAEATFLVAFARNVMQDSRGIDDHPDMVGRRTFMLKSCSQALDRQVVRSGKEEQLSTATTIAEAFAKAGSGVLVDIYAADAVVKTEPTENGLKYRTKQPDGRTYQDADAQKLTAHNGFVTRTQVAEIRLRRPTEEANTQTQDNSTIPRAA